MNTDVVDDNELADVLDCLDCANTATLSTASQCDDMEDTLSSSPLPWELQPLKDAESGVTTGDRMSLASSMLGSIVSGAIESIAMLSLGSMPEKEKECAKGKSGTERTGEGKQEESRSLQLVHDGPSTCVYHYNDPRDKFIEQAGGDIALKVLSDQFPDEKQILRLKNEHGISFHMADRCKAVRAAVGKSVLDLDGKSTLCLNWVPGITLREWARSHQKGREAALVASYENSDDNWKRGFFHSSLCLALEITKCLAEIHQVGRFIINNLSATNIIVDSSRGESGTLSVHFIGLGSASCLQIEKEKNIVNENRLEIQKDLQSLGEVLFELFSGRPLHQDHCDMNVENDQLPLRELRSILNLSLVPSYIAALVLDLMDIFETSNEWDTTKNNCGRKLRDDHYQSATQVEEELGRMFGSLDTILIDDRNVGWLHITPGRLYGRENEETKIINAYQRVTFDEAHEAVFLSGLSGVGKTMLVTETLRQPLLDNGGHLIHIKFDQLHHGEHLAAIIAAISELCTTLALCTEDKLRRMKCVIEKVVGQELMRVLTSTIPALCSIVGTRAYDSTVRIEGLMAKNQFKFAFKMLVNAFAELMGSLVLFFDDLQWADPASVEFLDALVMDNEIKSVLIIECYRSNEITENHLLNIHLYGVRKSGVVHTDIKVENLNESDVGKLISESIQEPICKTQMLADIIHHKTGGNALLVTQFVKSAWDEGLLHYSSLLKAWKWNTDLIKSKQLLNDAFILMAQSILCLPADTKYIVQKMACLGCQCEESILQVVAGGETKENADSMNNSGVLLHRLEKAIERGLIEKVGSKIKFTHDQIQNAAYFGIPKDKRECWHLQNGQQLLMQCDGKELDNNLFVIVDQLNRGRPIMKDEDGLIGLVKLNCRAGEKSISSVSFSSAASYLKTGISILDENQLKVESKFLIKMHVMYAEAEYCNGNFDEMYKSQEFIFKTAGCLDDKLDAYSTLIRSLMAENKMMCAIGTGLDLLSQLGQAFASNPDSSIILEEYSKTSSMMKKSNFATLTSKRIVDKRTEFIMEVLESLCLCAFYSKQEFLALFTFRMVQLTLSYGICASTPFCLATYSMLLCGNFDDIKGGTSYGNLALQILEYIQDERKVARVYAVLYTMTFIWSKPLRMNLEPLLEGCDRGMRVGDIQYAMVGATTYVISLFNAGKDLLFIKKYIKEIVNKANLYKHDAMKIFMLPLDVAVMSLIGRESDPVLLDGVEVTHETLLADAFKENDQQQICRTYFFQMIVAYMFGKYELAAQIADKNHDIISKRMSCKFEIIVHMFYYGLVSLALARKTNEDRWNIIFEKCKDKLQRLSEHAPDIEHKVLLLEAEYAFLCGEHNKARSKYTASAALAGKNCFVQDKALAHERAGIFYLEKGNESQALYYFGKAHSAYLEWGAKCKADHMCKSYSI